MAAENVEARVKTIIADQLGVGEDEVHSDKSFIEDLGADSLDMVELVMAIEEVFELDIPDDDTETLRTVKDAIDYVKEHVKPAA